MRVPSGVVHCAFYCAVTTVQVLLPRPHCAHSILRIPLCGFHRADPIVRILSVVQIFSCEYHHPNVKIPSCGFHRANFIVRWPSSELHCARSRMAVWSESPIIIIIKFFFVYQKSKNNSFFFFLILGKESLPDERSTWAVHNSSELCVFLLLYCNVCIVPSSYEWFIEVRLLSLDFLFGDVSLFSVSNQVQRLRLRPIPFRSWQQTSTTRYRCKGIVSNLVVFCFQLLSTAGDAYPHCRYHYGDVTTSNNAYAFMMFDVVLFGGRRDKLV